MSNETPVVSRRIVRKAHKIGHMRTTVSPETADDTAQASRVEETPGTRSYIKTTRVPSAPVPSGPGAYGLDHRGGGGGDDDYDDDDDGREDSFPVGERVCYIAGLILALLAVAYLGQLVMVVLVGVFTPPLPLEDKLVDIGWTFRGRVSELRFVTEEGWTLPADAVPLQSETRQRSTRTVLDHEETHCETVRVPEEVVIDYHTQCARGIVDWTAEREVYSHTETQCVRGIKGWTDELEVYSHTEELCYADGRCEEKDVYDRVAPEPIYGDLCEETDVYDTWPAEPIYGDVCEKVPITQTVWTPTEKCSVERVMRDDPVMGTWWTYTVHKWIATRTIERTATTPGTEREDVEALLGANERYDETYWRSGL